MYKIMLTSPLLNRSQSAFILALLLPIVMGGTQPTPQLVNIIHRSDSTVYLYTVPSDATYMDMTTNCRVLSVGTWAGSAAAPTVIRGQHVNIHDVTPTTVGRYWNVITHNFTYARIAVVVSGTGQLAPGVVGMCRGDSCYTADYDAVPTCPVLHFPLIAR